MGQRVVKFVLDAVAFTNAVQDIFSIKAPTGGGIELHSIRLTISGVSAPAEIPVRLKRLTGTVALGSGGTTITPKYADDGDAKTIGETIHQKDTTQATGTADLLDSQNWNVLLPYEYLPPPEDRDACQPSEAFVFEFPSAPGAAFTISGQVVYRPIP